MTSRIFHRLARVATQSPFPANLGRHPKNARTFVQSTFPLFEKKVIQVPTMGDSITEGTIVEWTVQVGQAVKDGDVVALVETDKVTVDIKADIDGVVTQQFGAVDDTVEVGSDLYELDTEAEATVEASTTASATSETLASSAPAPSPSPAAASPPAPSKASASSSSEAHRAPSIHFLGRDGWKKKLAGVPELPPVPKNYGRPAFTEEEMEALLTGGANLVPEVKDYSKGAVFGY